MKRFINSNERYYSLYCEKSLYTIYYYTSASYQRNFTWRKYVLHRHHRLICHSTENSLFAVTCVVIHSDQIIHFNRVKLCAVTIQVKSGTWDYEWSAINTYVYRYDIYSFNYGIQSNSMRKYLCGIHWWFFRYSMFNCEILEKCIPRVKRD